MNIRRIIGSAFIGCVIVYAILAQLVIGRGEAFPVAPELVIGFYGISLGALIAGLLILPRQNLPKGFVASMACCEVPAILGLMLAMISKSPRDFFVLGGSSVLALLYLTLKREV